VILIASVAGSKRFVGYAEMTESIVTDEDSFVTIGQGDTEMTTTKPFRIKWKKMYACLSLLASQFLISQLFQSGELSWFTIHEI
jgi:hypothetical protein